MTMRVRAMTWVFSGGGAAIRRRRRVRGYQAVAKLRLRLPGGVAGLGKMLTTLEVAPLFPSTRALPGSLMLVYPPPVTG